MKEDWKIGRSSVPRFLFVTTASEVLEVVQAFDDAYSRADSELIESSRSTPTLSGVGLMTAGIIRD